MPANDHDITVQLKELQTKIAKDDETAFTQLYLHFGKKLIHFATSLLRSKETAEELTEDVFVKLWANRLQIKEIENITVYLYVAVKNRALTSLSLKARQLVLAPFDFLDTSVDEFAIDPYEVMITSEMMNRMHHAVDALPPRCKMIFKLIREDGLKYKDVAEILNISVNTIDVQMAIAVKKICSALQIAKSANGFTFPEAIVPEKGLKKER